MVVVIIKRIEEADFASYIYLLLQSPKKLSTTFSTASSASSSFNDELLPESQQLPQQHSQQPVSNVPRQMKGQVNNFHHLNFDVFCGGGGC